MRLKSRNNYGVSVTFHRYITTSKRLVDYKELKKMYSDEGVRDVEVLWTKVERRRAS